MKTVFLVQHVHKLGPDEEDAKIVGIYSSEEKAESVVQRYKILPGFAEHGDGFDISEYRVDEDHWEEGFFTEHYREKTPL